MLLILIGGYFDSDYDNYYMKREVFIKFVIIITKSGGFRNDKSRVIDDSVLCFLLRV